MSLTTSRSTFERTLIRLWKRYPVPSNAVLFDIEPIVRTFWNSAIVTGYPSLSISCAYENFISYIREIDSGNVTASTIEDGAENFETLFRKIIEDTTFESSDASIEFLSIQPIWGYPSYLGVLKDSLVPLFQAGIEGRPRIETIVSTLADFFLSWEVEVDDNGTLTRAAIS